MKNIFLKITLFVAFIGIIVTGCQKEEMNELAEPEVVINDFNEKSAAIEELAIATAAAMVDPDFRMSIKSEAMKQFDGDYDILYSRLAKQSLKNGNQGNFYLNKLSESYKSTEKNSKAYIESLISQIPKFQIAVPVHCENWDVQNHTPLVAYIPANFDEKTFTKVKAFDKDGNVHWLPLDKEPDFPVVVLGYNERTDENGNLLESGFKYIQPDPGDGTGGSGPGGGFNYDANSLYLIKLKFNDLSAYEKWISGKPEIYIDIHSDITQYRLGQLYSKPKRNEVNETWKTYNHKFCSWPNNVDRLYAKCYEKDVNVTVTITFEIPLVFKLGIKKTLTLSPSLSIKTQFRSGDDDMGTYMILKSDASTGLYSNDNLNLYFKH